MKHLMLALALAPISAQDTPSAPADRAALEARWLALVSATPMGVKMQAETNAHFNQARYQWNVTFDSTLAEAVKRNPGKEAVIRPILTNFGTCMLQAIPAALVQIKQRMLANMSDDDLRHSIAFYAGPDAARMWELSAKGATDLDATEQAELKVLAKKYSGQVLGERNVMELGLLVLPARLMHDCIITMEKASVHAGIDTGAEGIPHYQHEDAFVAAAGPSLTARFRREAGKRLSADTAREASGLADANPGRQDVIAAIIARETLCKEKANVALAERLPPTLAATLPDALLDRMAAFYTSPDGTRYTALEQAGTRTKADDLAFNALRKKYALDQFDQYYSEAFSADAPFLSDRELAQATTIFRRSASDAALSTDPEWAAANRDCDAATDQALAAAKLIRPPEPTESRE